MARRGSRGEQSAKEQGPVKAPETEQEEEAPQQDDREQEHQRDQNTYGNAALSALLGASVAGAAGEGGGPGLAERELEEELSGDIAYGGDDDGVDVPLTLEELTRSWNPRARRGKDSPTEQCFALWEDLPPEDEPFIAEIRKLPRPQTPAMGLGDSLYQPTAESVASGLSPWAREVRHWVSPTLDRRALLQLISPPAAFLQDPDGRAVLSRARSGAIASCVLLDELSPTPSTAALTQFCLELAGSGMRVQQVWDAAEAGEAQLPMARDLCAAALPASSHRVRPRGLPPFANQRLIDGLSRLAGLSSPRGFIPDLQPVESVEDADDPLGLDEVLAAFTGATEAPDQATYDTALRTAERLASACAHTRIRYAGVSAAIGAICSHWSSGSPTADLLDISSELDAEIQSCLKLLVDVARAAKGRAVAPTGLRNGLKRSARLIERSRRAAAKRMASLIGGVILPNPHVSEEHKDPQDRLSAAWEDGIPAAVLEALLEHPEGLERTVAVTLTEATLSNDAKTSVRALGQLSNEIRPDRPLLSAALDICRGGCAVWAEDPNTALEVAARTQTLGRTRRNGMILASGALTAMAALELQEDYDGLQEKRLCAGGELFHMGSAAGVSLLARWSPREEES